MSGREIALSVGEILEGLPVPNIRALDEWKSRVRGLQGQMMPLLTPEEAAAWAGVPVETIGRALPFIKIGALRRFAPKDVMALVAGAFSMTSFRAAKLFENLESTKGNVYFIEAVGADRVKIGFTEGPPEARMRRLQTAAPFELRLLCSLPGSMAIERYLHREHALERILPTAEWFHHRGTVSELVQHILQHRKWP